MAYLPELGGPKGFAWGFWRSKEQVGGEWWSLSGCWLPLQQFSRTKGSCSKSRAQEKELKGWGGTACPGGKDNQEAALPLFQAVVQFPGSRTGILADLHGLEVLPAVVTLGQVWLGVAAAWWASTCSRWVNPWHGHRR